jgi:hypothetical protein
MAMIENGYVSTIQERLPATSLWRPANVPRYKLLPRNRQIILKAEGSGLSPSGLD